MKWNDITVLPKVCGFVYWSADHMIPKQWFRSYVRDFDLWLFTEGNGCLHDSNGVEWELKRGSIILLRPCHVYEAWQTVGKERIGTFWFHMDLLASPRNEYLKAANLRSFPFYCETCEPGFFEFTARKIVSLMRGNMDKPPQEWIPERYEASLLLKSLLMELEREAREEADSQLIGVELHHKKIINKVVSDIYESPEKCGSSAQLARLSGYSPDYFGRLFRRFTGRTPLEVLIDARIDKAKKLLGYSDLNVGQIAESLGYHNIYFFSRQFREKTGISPQAFRRQMAGRKKIN